MKRKKLVITHYEIALPENVRKPSKGVRLVMLADLHDEQFGAENATLVEAVRVLAPSVILSAGDLITAGGGRYHTQHTRALLPKLREICPVYVSEGNHELRPKLHKNLYGDLYDRYLHCLQSAGIQVLADEGVRVKAGGMQLEIAGFSVPLEYYSRFSHPKEIAAQDLERLSLPWRQKTGTAAGAAGERAYRILLAHHPDYFYDYTLLKPDLVLAGHLHGGMIRLPFLGGVVGADLKPFPRYDKGMYAAGRRGPVMIVSAGLGAHSIPVRINNPREIVCIDLLPSGREAS